MTVASLIRDAERAGLSLTLSPTGSVVLKGPRHVRQAWRPRLKEHKNSIRAELLGISQCQDGRRSWWRIYRTDQPPTAVSCNPETTHQQMRELHPEALRIEPHEPQITIPTRTLSTDEEMAIRWWLGQIGETDQDIIDHVLRQANIDQEAREFFLTQTAVLHSQD